MGRNLVVFADGTGNSARSPFKTNVWRLYQALDLRDPDQLAAFVDGVGTSSFKVLRVLGLALGIGVKRNVIELYKFLCRNYQDGDRIYCFGFSRGAFTIRVLNGLIHHEGLIDWKSEEELNRNAVDAYRAYRAKSFKSRWFQFWVWGGRAIRDAVIRAKCTILGVRSYPEIVAATAAAGRDTIGVAFLGVWDTVAAYGLPINELTEAVDRWIWPMSFRDRTLASRVQLARHALSLDDERETFFPILWQETAARQSGQQLSSGDKLVQLWFAGVHANVGGGYPDDALAHVSLCWMIDEAAAARLRFAQALVDSYRAIASDMGLLYDSRSGFGTLYRYHPRDIAALMSLSGSGPNVSPLIDNSVILRMAYGNDSYVPIPLREAALVRAPNGCLIDLSGPPSSNPPKTTPTRADRLDEAIQTLRASDIMVSRRNWLDLALDTVWWRRVAYFLTLFLCLFLALFPIVGGYLNTGRSAADDAMAAGWLQALVRLASGFVPSFAMPWLSAFATHSGPALALGFALLGCLSWSALLQYRIRNRLRAAWNAQAIRDARMLDTIRTKSHRRTSVQGFLWCSAGLVLSLSFVHDHGASIGSRAFWAIAFWDDPYWLIRWLLTIGTVTTLAGVIGSVLPFGRGRIFDPAKPGPGLRIARCARASSVAYGLYRAFAGHIFPFIALVGTVLAVGLGANRAAIDIASSRGALCTASIAKETPPVTTVATAPKPFDVSDVCWASGLRLAEGAHYRIWLTMPEDMNWFDRGIHADVGGFPARSVAHVVATPLKRWWGENWFQPIARIGAIGLEEYVLTPIDPLPPLPDTELAAETTVLGSPCCSIEALTKRMDASQARDETRAHPRPGRRRLIAEIKPQVSDELFLYVNDAMFALPGFVSYMLGFESDIRESAGFYYRNNFGSASVTVERIRPPSPPAVVTRR